MPAELEPARTRKTAGSKRVRGPRRQPVSAAPVAIKPPRGKLRPKPGKVRKPRQARAQKVDVTKLVPALVGLKEPEARAVLEIQKVFDALNKKGRQRVIGVLARIHG